MYLAGILGLCTLLHGPVCSRLSNASAVFGALSASAQSAASQPAQQESPPSESPKPAPSQQTPPPDSAQPPETQPEKGAAKAQASPTNQTPAKTPAKPSAASKKKHAPPAPGQTPPKKVVRQGSTADPTTQLAPGISQEQATRQRQTTNQLLTSTSTALQKLSGQPLSSDQQETVVQIRNFMEQSRAADKDGDLQLAYKLALKAHLLSDGLSRE